MPQVSNKMGSYSFTWSALVFCAITIMSLSYRIWKLSVLHSYLVPAGKKIKKKPTQINISQLIYNETASSLTLELNSQAWLEIIGQGSSKSLHRNNQRSFLLKLFLKQLWVLYRMWLLFQVLVQLQFITEWALGIKTIITFLVILFSALWVALWLSLTRFLIRTMVS